MGASDNIPCAVRADELAHDAGLQEAYPQDIQRAREALTEKLLEGGRIGYPLCGFDALLDNELNESCAATVQTLAGFFLGIDALDEYGRLDRLQDMSRFAKRLIERHLDANEELARDLAIDYANERDDA